MATRIRSPLRAALILPALIFFTGCVPKDKLVQAEIERDQARRELADANEKLALFDKASNGQLVRDYQNLQTKMQTLERENAEAAGLRRQLDACSESLRNLQADHAQSQTTPVQVPTYDTMESKIDGQWDGWYGNSVIRLINGTIWQQAGAGISVSVRYMPDVVIFRSGGGYKAMIEGERNAVSVVRIK